MLLPVRSCFQRRLSFCSLCAKNAFRSKTARVACQKTTKLLIYKFWISLARWKMATVIRKSFLAHLPDHRNGSPVIRQQGGDRLIRRAVAAFEAFLFWTFWFWMIDLRTGVTSSGGYWSLKWRFELPSRNTIVDNLLNAILPPEREVLSWSHCKIELDF